MRDAHYLPESVALGKRVGEVCGLKARDNGDTISRAFSPLHFPATLPRADISRALGPKACELSLCLYDFGGLKGTVLPLGHGPLRSLAQPTGLSSIARSIVF